MTCPLKFPHYDVESGPLCLLVDGATSLEGFLRAVWSDGIDIRPYITGPDNPQPFRLNGMRFQLGKVTVTSGGARLNTLLLDLVRKTPSERHGPLLHSMMKDFDERHRRPDGQAEDARVDGLPRRGAGVAPSVARRIEAINVSPVPYDGPMTGCGDIWSEIPADRLAVITAEVLSPPQALKLKDLKSHRRNAVIQWICRGLDPQHALSCNLWSSTAECRTDGVKPRA